MSRAMIRLVAFLLALCLSWQIAPRADARASQVAVSCHEENIGGHRDAPVDQKAPQSHMCLGCAVPLTAYEFDAPSLAPASDIVWRAGPRAERSRDGVDPPPPRAEG